MKTKLLILAIFCITAGTASAQKLHVGIKGGANINKLTGKSFDDQFSFGYHVGGFFSVGLGKKFAIQPEILFNQINVDTSNNYSTVYQFNKVDKVQLKYLSIPILLTYKPIKFITYGWWLTLVIFVLPASQIYILYMQHLKYSLIPYQVLVC